MEWFVWLSRVEVFRLHKGDYDYFVKNIQVGTQIRTSLHCPEMIFL